jgi:hypothetical protein
MVSIVISVIVYGSTLTQGHLFKPPRHHVYVQMTSEGINAKQHIILHQVCLPVEHHGQVVRGLTEGTARWRVEVMVLPEAEGKLYVEVGVRSPDGASIRTAQRLRPGERFRVLIPQPFECKEAVA